MIQAKMSREQIDAMNQGWDLLQVRVDLDEMERCTETFTMLAKGSVEEVSQAVKKRMEDMADYVGRKLGTVEILRLSNGKWLGLVDASKDGTKYTRKDKNGNSIETWKPTQTG